MATAKKSAAKDKQPATKKSTQEEKKPASSAGTQAKGTAKGTKKK